MAKSHVAETARAVAELHRDGLPTHREAATAAEVAAQQPPSLTGSTRWRALLGELRARREAALRELTSADYELPAVGDFAAVLAGYREHLAKVRAAREELRLLNELESYYLQPALAEAEEKEREAEQRQRHARLRQEEAKARAALRGDLTLAEKARALSQLAAVRRELRKLENEWGKEE